MEIILCSLYVAICLLTIRNYHFFRYFCTLQVPNFSPAKQNISKHSRNMFNVASNNNYYYYTIFFFSISVIVTPFQFVLYGSLLSFPSPLILPLLLLMVADSHLRIQTDSLWVYDTVNLCDNEICRSKVHQIVNKKSINMLS